MMAVCEISIMICEIASVNLKMNDSGDGRLRNDDATSIASYHIIAISSIEFRHYNLFYIYRAVPFLTLWPPSRHSRIRELPFWTSMFVS